LGQGGVFPHVFKGKYKGRRPNPSTSENKKGFRGNKRREGSAGKLYSPGRYQGLVENYHGIQQYMCDLQIWGKKPSGEENPYSEKW